MNIQASSKPPVDLSMPSPVSAPPQQQQQPLPQQRTPTQMHEIANVAPRPTRKRLFHDWAAL